MATVHKGYRLDVELVERIDAWAEAHGMTQAEAVRTLLTTALDGGVQREETPRATADAELRAELGQHIRDMREHISTLTAQLAEKDRQLKQAHDLADHAQQLQAVSMANRLQEAERKTLRTRLARWLAGRRED